MTQQPDAPSDDRVSRSQLPQKGSATAIPAEGGRSVAQPDLVTVVHSSEIADDPAGFHGDYVPAEDYYAALEAVASRVSPETPSVQSGVACGKVFGWRHELGKSRLAVISGCAFQGTTGFRQAGVGGHEVKFRKKPVVIEAVQWLGDRQMICEFMNFQEDVIFFNDDGTLGVPTLEGEMMCSPGDWLIRGVKGEIYPCKPDIFAATYEPVVGESTS